MRLPQAHRAVVTPETVRDYLLSPAHVVGPSIADAEILRARRTDLEQDGEPGEPWRQTIQELKAPGA